MSDTFICAGHYHSDPEKQGLVGDDDQGRAVEHLHPVTGERCPGSGTMVGDEVRDPCVDYVGWGV